MGNTNEVNAYFSTDNSDVQTTLVRTDNSTFTAGFATCLGALGAGESYQVSSAMLVVGDSVDDYNPTGSTKESHLMLVSYDPTTITWNIFNTLGGAGTAYATANLATGTGTDTNADSTLDTVTWDFTNTVKAWLAGTTTNNGIYFSGTGTATGTPEYAAIGKVRWQINAIRTTVVSAPINLTVDKQPTTFASEIKVK